MCVLRAWGVDFDVDAFLARSSIEVCNEFRRGQATSDFRPDGPRNERSGFTGPVSEKEWDDLAGQVQDAESYLILNAEEIRRLRAFPGVEGIELDFPIDLRIGTNDIVIQSDHLPVSLLLAAGTLGVQIRMSIYPPCADDEPEPKSDDASA